MTASLEALLYWRALATQYTAVEPANIIAALGTRAACQGILYQVLYRHHLGYLQFIGISKLFLTPPMPAKVPTKVIRAGKDHEYGFVAS